MPQWRERCNVPYSFRILMTNCRPFAINWSSLSSSCPLDDSFNDYCLWSRWEYKGRVKSLQILWSLLLRVTVVSATDSGVIHFCRHLDPCSLRSLALVLSRCSSGIRYSYKDRWSRRPREMIAKNMCEMYSERFKTWATCKWNYPRLWECKTRNRQKDTPYTSEVTSARWSDACIWRKVHFCTCLKSASASKRFFARWS